jgi:hypothetical protein
MKTTRRDFLRLGALFGVSLALPKLPKVPDVLPVQGNGKDSLEVWRFQRTIDAGKLVAYEVDEDLLGKCMTFGAPYNRDGKCFMPVGFDAQRAMEEAITFLDANDNRYSYHEVRDIQSLLA